MVISNRIFVGCRVEGPHGPLFPNPNSKIKRRLRTRVVGTVLRANGQHRWVVQFDFNGKIKECTSKLLKLVADEVGVPLNEEIGNNMGNTSKFVKAHEVVDNNNTVSTTLVIYLHSSFIFKFLVTFFIHHFF